MLSQKKKFLLHRFLLRLPKRKRLRNQGNSLHRLFAHFRSEIQEQPIEQLQPVEKPKGSETESSDSEGTENNRRHAY